MQAHQLSPSATRDVNAPLSLLTVAQGRGLAHDARNLLGALGLYCDLLDMPGVLQSRHRHYARELRLLSQRSGSLIEQLLVGQVEQVEKAEQAALLSPSDSTGTADPAGIMRQFAPLLRFLAEPDATVSTACAAGLPMLPFEPEVLERIIVNLTRNAATVLRSHGARDAEGQAVGGQIHIALCGGKDHLRLSVMDNGPGMTDATVAAFLNPAPLAPKAVSGIGHRVVNELVRSTGGTLQVTITPRRGTTIQIDWPVQDSALRTIAQPPEGTDQRALPRSRPRLRRAAKPTAVLPPPSAAQWSTPQPF